MMEWAPFLPPAWYVDALCARVDPELFFPEGTHGREAKKVCAACPVRDQCLGYAIDNHEQEGIWGGLSPSGRRRRKPAPSASPDPRAA